MSNGRYILMGVTSFGATKPCAASPLGAVFASLHDQNVINWIRGIAGNECA